ncbi:hypothetical protein LIER_19309 [Lithospermum erythrorhizon]|uniref:Uncharacterized protein n=1 Tax=Lithospermum erythrorhizon TaxID=34254 RepID=A0AAV3QKC2_LITER
MRRATIFCLWNVDSYAIELCNYKGHVNVQLGLVLKIRADTQPYLDQLHAISDVHKLCFLTDEGDMVLSFFTSRRLHMEVISAFLSAADSFIYQTELSQSGVLEDRYKVIPLVQSHTTSMNLLNQIFCYNNKVSPRIIDKPSIFLKDVLMQVPKPSQFTTSSVGTVSLDPSPDGG